METYHRYPNLLNRDFTATRPNQNWVTDITNIRTQQGWGYLSTIKDLFDSFIVAYAFALTPSMSRCGNCWDNAPIENFFGQLKEEYLRHHKNPTFAEAEQLIAEYIYFYNYERIQLKTKQTPYQTRCLFS